MFWLKKIQKIFNFLTNSFKDTFTTKIEKLVQTLVMAERYEAVGPVCRLAIPMYEQQKNYRVSSFFVSKKENSSQLS